MASNREGGLPSPQKPLKEKDFIHEGFLGNPFPVLISFAVVFAVTALIWGGSSWYQSFMSHQYAESPFLRVTNRDFSVFLWQFPEYMRANVKVKTGYLTGFQYENKVTPILGDVDDYVVAPPELLFLYHTWDRLLRPEFTEGAIPENQFIEFLNYCEEWQPRNWAAAPKAYVEMVDSLNFKDAEKSTKDLARLSKEQLPVAVRMAYQGWHNYFKDYPEINGMQPTYAEMHQFLETHPHYARSYWQNIVMEYNPYYLISYTKAKAESDEIIPSKELAPFLRVGFYNSLGKVKLIVDRKKQGK